MNARTDVDLRFIEVDGTITQQVLDPSQAMGDICLNDDNTDYPVEKALMGGSGQLQPDILYLAEDRTGNGALNP